MVVVLPLRWMILWHCHIGFATVVDDVNNNVAIGAKTD